MGRTPTEDALYILDALPTAVAQAHLEPEARCAARLYRKSLFPGMIGEPAVVAAAKARFPDALPLTPDGGGLVDAPPGTKPDALLLNLQHASPGSPLDRLATTLARSESLGHVLPWTFDAAAASGSARQASSVSWCSAVEPGQLCELQSVGLPRLETELLCRELSKTQV